MLLPIFLKNMASLLRNVVQYMSKEKEIWKHILLLEEVQENLKCDKSILTEHIIYY